MRKYQQKQILNLLKTLEEAQNSGLYADCQECALQIGEFIEKIEGEDTHTVSLLEEYCELLYKANIGEVNKNKLRKQLIKIENSVLDGLTANKLEVLFLPYSVSMWDSLESVYFAADNDPDCNAVVMPIPYYEFNSEHTFEKMYYDGDKYPDYIPVVDWKNYNIEEIRPDIIYIHNQYDNQNVVTSVHPDYYSFNLKKHTDMLVYIPYGIPTFLTEKPGAGKESEANKEKGLRTYSNFDITILQDETIRKPGGNVAVLGSPKYDKVLGTKREDCKIPDEWRHIIADRKIVLYNTSLAAMLTGVGDYDSSVYFKKMLKVFENFNKRDDLVLWWRPHPLFAVTISTMRRELLNIYNRIVSSFKREKFAIYDDTPDIHRAIAMSDAYYGDASSVVNLYGLTGKPIVIQDITLNKDGGCPGTGAWKLDFEKDSGEKASVADYLIYEQPAEHGAYSFLSHYLKNTAIVPGEKESFAEASVNADGTVGAKIHAYVMDALKSARETKENNS